MFTDATLSSTEVLEPDAIFESLPVLETASWAPDFALGVQPVFRAGSDAASPVMLGFALECDARVQANAAESPRVLWRKAAS